MSARGENSILAAGGLSDKRRDCCWVFWSNGINWLNLLLQGILLGGFYALFAAGLSLVFGVMRIVNLAHGDLSIVAAYIAFVLFQVWGLSPLISVIVAAILMFGFGFVLQRFLLNLSIGGDVMRPLLVTFGISIIIQNVLLEVFSADLRSLNAGVLGTGGFEFTRELAIGWLPLFTFAVGVGVLAALALFLARTRLGRAFRATSDSLDTAELMGIDHRQVYSLAMGAALAIVAVGGIFMGLRTNFGPALGPMYLLFAFEAVVIGGLGSVWGTLAGGVTLGIAQTIGAELSPGLAVLAGHLVFLVILSFRPQGLFPKTVEG